MAKEQIVKLYRDAQADATLKAALNDSASIEDFVKLAKTYGYEFTCEEWQETMQFKVEELDCKLSEIPGL